MLIFSTIYLAGQTPIVLNEGQTRHFQINRQSNIVQYSWIVFSDSALTVDAGEDVTIVQGGTGNEQEVDVTWNVAGLYYIMVHVTDDKGCTNKMARPVEVNPVKKYIITNSDYFVYPGCSQSLVLDILANDVDVENRGLVTSILDFGHSRRMEVLSKDSLLYTPMPGFVGTDTIVYQVCVGDLPGVCTVDTAFVEVEHTVGLPIALNDTVDVYSGNSVTLNVFENDTIFGEVVINDTISPISGMATMHSEGKITYQSDIDFSGLDSMLYYVNGYCGYDSAWVFFNVEATIENNFVAACDDSAPYFEWDISASGVATDTTLINVYDGDGLLVETYNAMNFAGRELWPGTTFGEFMGLRFPIHLYDSLRFEFVVKENPYLAWDSGFIQNPGCYENKPVVAVDDESETDLNMDVEIPIVFNDFDPEGMLDTTSVVIIDGPQYGTVIINDDGTIDYLPDGFFVGEDKFTYVICDEVGDCDSATVTIEINDNVNLPNVFTPNGDGENDTYKIHGLEKYPGSSLEIYNRWGNLVYRNGNYDNSWDGFANVKLVMGNKSLPVGTYFYIFEYGEGKSKTGWIFLEK